jgi:hypothetical protein
MEKPKTRRYAFLSVIWPVIPAVAFVVCLLDGWPPLFSSMKWWCVAALIAPELMFVALAIWHVRTEKSRPKTEWVPKPDADLRNFH